MFQRRSHLVGGGLAGTRRMAKLFFLMFPWLLVAAGINVLQTQLAFVNNAIETSAIVVPLRPSEDPVDLAPGTTFKPVFLRPPSYLYRHENGLDFVGGPIVQPFPWRDVAGEKVVIRYNRLFPQQAQPVTFLRFWWIPTSLIGGGVLAFLLLALSFYARPLIAQRQKRGSLQLRRR